MNVVTVDTQIKELERLRSRIRAWRAGTTAAAILVAVICVWSMNNAVQSLFRPGPQQEEFVSTVSAGLQRTVVPNLQQLAVRTAMESRPIVETEFNKLNNRVPDVAQASMREFETLQTELPQRTEKALDDSFGTMIAAHEPKLRELYPDTSDDKIKALLGNLVDEGHTQLSVVNNQLFSRHLNAMSDISHDIADIEKSEPATSQDSVSTWNMGMMLFNIAQAESNSTAAKDSSGSSGKSAPAKASGGTQQPGKQAARPAAAPKGAA